MNAIKKLFIFLFLAGSTLAVTAQNREVSGSTGVPGMPPSTRTGPSLYDQISNPGSGFVVSQEFTDPGNMLNTSQLADDFVVPAGETWNIGTVATHGYYFYGSPGGVPNAVNVYFYADDNGMPGTELYALLNLSSFTWDSFINTNGYEETYIETVLSPAISLTAGTYWLSFQVVGDYNVIGQWGWGDAANDPPTGSEFHWQNPGDGFGTGFITWTPGSQVIWFGYLDAAFALYEESYDHDLAAKGLVNPVSSQILGSTETITMTIKNEGMMAETGFDVSYSVNGGTPVVENVGGLSINPEIYSDYSFATTADLSAPGIYNIEVNTLLTGDMYTGNDSYTAQVVNYGTIYEMEDGVNITSCSGTFTDPGGIDGNFGQNDAATMTIYPETTGSMVRLTFMEFDVYWSDFYIYDGEDTDAPLIGYYQTTNSPGVVTALNSAGALTIDFAAPGWADGQGWVAVISCYQQPEDDFIVTEFTHTPYTIYNGRDFMLSATVRNIGSLAQSKDVTFYVDGAVIGTVNTGVLQSTEYATVTLETSISTVGSHTASVSLPEDQGEDPANNTAQMDLDVYLAGSLVEFFEGPSFPPDFWACGPYWDRMSGYGYALHGDWAAHAFVEAGFYDTLWTPQLVISPGDSLSFWAKTSLWWYGGLTMVCKDGVTGDVTDLAELTLNDTRYEQFELDLTAATGNNYIGFVVYVNDPWSWQGEAFVDDVIGNGPELYFMDYDMTCYDLTGSVTPTVNETAPFDLTVRNIGALDVGNGGYSVQLFQLMDDGQEVLLQAMNGQPIEHLEEIVYTFTPTFEASGPVSIFARVVFGPDMNTGNNQTPVTELNVQVAGTVEVEVGDDEVESWWIPLYPTSPYSLTETVYPDDMISETGMITGIKYFYNNSGYDPHVDVPVSIWLDITDEQDMTGGWVPSTEMTLVATDSIDLLVGVHELYIPFDVPFSYDGGNLMSMVFKEPVDPQVWSSVTFLSTPVNDTLTGWATSYDTINPAEPESTAYLNKELAIPNTNFFINTAGLGEVGGMVYDEEGNPFPGVQVKLDGYSITTTTDENGAYFFNEIIAGSQTFTASIFAYEDNTQPLEVLAGVYNQLDFNMVLKPQVAITGTLVGNDDPAHFLEGANVSLSGYFNFGASSDENGDFFLSSVYGNETYTLTIIMDGYETYVDNNVVVAGTDLDMGTIEMVEIWHVPFSVSAVEEGNAVQVSWQIPNTGDDAAFEYDININNGYANEPYENVWLGNIYETGVKGSITTVSIYWAFYNTFSDYVTLDIMDSTGHVIMTSEPFLTEKNDWTDVDIPDVAFDQTFYAMVHWQDNSETTDFLAIDEDVEGNGGTYYGYIDYPDWEEPLPISSVLGHEGTFEIVVQTIVEGEARSFGGRWLESYNVYRGLLEDANNASSWQALNMDPVTGTVYTDDTWPPIDAGEYVYATKALFSTGESVMSFSNPILYDPGVGMEEGLTNDGFALFPNPASDRLYLLLPEGMVTVSLFDATGKALESFQATGSVKVMPVSHLPEGVYILRIQTDNGIFSKKLLISR